MNLQAYAKEIKDEHRVSVAQSEKVNVLAVARPERLPDAVAPGWQVWLESPRGRTAMVVGTLFGAVLQLFETRAESRERYCSDPAGPAHFKRGALEARIVGEGAVASVVLSGPLGLHVVARAGLGGQVGPAGVVAGGEESNRFVTADVMAAAVAMVREAGGKPVDFADIVEAHGEDAADRAAEYPGVVEEPIGYLSWRPSTG